MASKLYKVFLLLLGGGWLGTAGGVCPDFSKAYSHRVYADKEASTYIWQEKKVYPFNELIVSWNALRPTSGNYTLYVRVKGARWSKWFKYAAWGVTHQQTFSSSKDDVASLCVNAVMMKNKGMGVSFEVKVEAAGGASMSDVHWLHACVSNTAKYKLQKPSRSLRSGYIDYVPQQSQMILKHPRSKSMCSPTATSTAVSYLLQRLERGSTFDQASIVREVIDPVDFASLVYDTGHHIYGNWALNVAGAYDVSGGKIPCRVEHLPSFDVLYDYLRHDRPVVVSVAGPIKGGALPYKHGHLMVVIGWDARRRRVLCIDSAFKSNNATKVWYDSDEFCRAWGRRKNLSYIFMPLS